MRRKGLQYQPPTCFVLGSQGQPEPTAADLLWQVNMALAYGFQGISYYTYWVWGIEPLAITYLDSLPTGKHAEVRRINQQAANLGPTLTRLAATGVYHIAESLLSCARRPAGLPLGVQGERPIVLGMYPHEDGAVWAIVANRDHLRGNEVRLDVADSVSRLEELRPATGALRPLTLAGETAARRLRPAERRLFRLR